MYFDDEIIPALVPIKTKKKAKKTQEERPPLGDDDVLHIFARQFQRRNPQQQEVKPSKQAKPPIGQQKMQELQRKYSALMQKAGQDEEEKDKNIKSMQSKKQKENMKSKYMINQMMKKIDAKNITEELYPMTNEVILDFIRKLDHQIQQLKIQGERKENSLITNPNNQHLKKELSNIKNSIDHCVTIKGLYNEKINLRNKVSTLERQIVCLKEENQGLKTKNQKDLQTMQNHMHGKPCQKERQLKDELNKCKIQMKKVTQIKQKLQNNISEIVQYFKRLYEEADVARLIVNKKLKELQQKEKKTQNSQPIQEKDDNLKLLSDKDISPISQNNNTSNLNPQKIQKKGFQQSILQKVNTKESQKPALGNTKNKVFSLEEQIKKMRNQANLTRTQYKR